VFGELLLVALILCFFAAAGSLYWLNKRKPAEPVPVKVERYVPQVSVPGRHFHAAGSVSAAAKGWYCDVVLDNGQVCGLHYHKYELPIEGEKELRRCMCSATGVGKEWSRE
jgi:hypothetical protein